MILLLSVMGGVVLVLGWLLIVARADARCYKDLWVQAQEKEK